MSETTFSQREGKRYSCPQCGGGLIYDIASGKMKCDHCGDLSPVPADEESTDASGSMEVTEFRCPQCGAAVYSSDTAATSFCSFCGSDVVLTAKLNRVRRPAAIVPFAVTREACEEKYRQHLKRYHLCPADLKSTETISHFRPVYVPFWSYRVQGEGPVSVKGVKSYTKGDKRYDETWQFTFDAKVDRRGILYDASTAFEDETAALLAHTGRDAVPFQSAYLSGLYAQVADVEPENYHAEAYATAAKEMIEKVRSASGMDAVTGYQSANGAYGVPNPKISQELVMLPVWLLAHRQGQRVVYTAINGRSGEVVCDIPVSMRKVLGVIALLGVLFFLLLQLLLTLRPDKLMVLCAGLTLATQLCFLSARRRLKERADRVYEPDFAGSGREYIGPAQMLLAAKERRSVKTAKRTESGVPWVGLVVVGLVAGFNLLPPFLRSVMNGIGDFSFETLNKLLMLAMLAVSVWRLPLRQGDRSAPSWIVSLAILLTLAVGTVLLFQGRSEDMVYYGCCAAMMAAAIGGLTLINREHNEYASRPVPFFEKEENP